MGRGLRTIKTWVTEGQEGGISSGEGLDKGVRVFNGCSMAESMFCEFRRGDLRHERLFHGQ